MKELVRPPTLDAAAANNKDEIVHGRLLPGEPLHEMELCCSLNISRGTLREALRLLQQEGLVEVIAHRGAFVAELSPQRVKEIYTTKLYRSGRVPDEISHRAILDGIAAGEPAQIEQIVCQHIYNIGSSLLESREAH